MSILIKDTTRAEREQIVADCIGNIEGACDGCAPGLLRMYDAYIEGRMELREVNMAFRAGMIKADSGPAERENCEWSNV